MSSYSEKYIKEKLSRELNASYVVHPNSQVFLGALGVLVAILLRCCTSLHPYSGRGRPPMFGDYEAQRHWMEITLHLPYKEWYRNSSRNDLQYWGLDYPPLTAYHSYLCGVVASFVDPSYVELRNSRGYESDKHKLFMRYTVLLADLLLYVPAVVFYFVSVDDVPSKDKPIPKYLRILLALFYPGIILIDHGHFQYNCVSLGLAIFAITFVRKGRHVLASVLFCLALNYKQMELYHSVPFFVYLLGTCVPQSGQSVAASARRLCNISGAVLITFAVVWSPFLLRFEDAVQVVHRLFPVGRGVFEDKVANVWCAANVYFKFKINFGHQQMLRLCLLATVGAILPSSLDLFMRPDVRKFVPALINSSLAFFLFSFQVHEKSILLAAVPVALHLHERPVPCFWFLIASAFSMLPLLVKDRLVVAFVALASLYAVAFCAALPQMERALPREAAGYRTPRGLFTGAALGLSLTGYVALTVSALVLEPPGPYPDLYALLTAVYSCVHFLGFFVYFNAVQFRTVGDARTCEQPKSH